MKPSSALMSPISAVLSRTRNPWSSRRTVSRLPLTSFSCTSVVPGWLPSTSRRRSTTGGVQRAAGIDTSTTNLLTVEDPIEYELPGIGQTQVNTKIDLVPHEAKRKKVDVVLSNSFGFGGTNASLVMRRVD